MNPQFGAPPLGIPSYQQMQAAFNSIGQQQQQMWYNNQYQQFQIFCQTRGLNPNDPNSFPLFYQQMISNINNQQPHSPQVFPPPQPPQVFPPSQPPQFFPPSQPPQIIPQPQPPQIIPQPQPPQIIPQPQPPQIIPQPHQPFIPQNPHGIAPIQRSSSGGNEPYVRQNMTEKIPRGDKTVYIKSDNQNASNIINIALKASSGLNVILAVPSNLPVREFFKRYVEKLGLPYGYIGNDIQFLYNGTKVDPFSNEPVSSKFKNGINITVYDQAGVIGAS